MDARLKGILESLLLNIEVLGDSLIRLSRSEQFTPTSQCFQLIEQIRGACLCSLQTARSIERNLHRRNGSSPAEEAAFPPHDTPQ